MTETAVKVQKHLFEGEWDGETYEVLIDGVLAGTARRDDATPTGYWGRWMVGTHGTDTRKSAVNYIVARYARRHAEPLRSQT